MDDRGPVGDNANRKARVEDYIHRDEETFKRLFPANLSGNDVNGLGVETKGPPQPFFWHPGDRQPFGELQQAVIGHHRQAPEIAHTYSRDADRGPRPVPKADEVEHLDASQWSKRIKAFGQENESDLIGLTPVRPEYVYEGYEITHPWLIIVGVSMEHDLLSTAPNTIEDVRAATEVADKYNQAARAARKIANYILANGYEAKTFPGPMATALNMLPAAIAAGLGELGKHGSLINRTYGSSFRLSAVSTNMPMVADTKDDFGADEFCASCRVCETACPPKAIHSQKQTVRGNHKWYVDFDKCIPYFGETFGCALCLAVCPWSRPGVAPRLAEKLARREARKNAT